MKKRFAKLLSLLVGAAVAGPVMAQKPRPAALARPAAPPRRAAPAKPAAPPRPATPAGVFRDRNLAAAVQAALHLPKPDFSDDNLAKLSLLEV